MFANGFGCLLRAFGVLRRSVQCVFMCAVWCGMLSVLRRSVQCVFMCAVWCGTLLVYCGEVCSVCLCVLFGAGCSVVCRIISPTHMQCVFMSVCGFGATLTLPFVEDALKATLERLPQVILQVVCILKDVVSNL